MPTTDEDAAVQAIATLETLSEEQKIALQSINAILRNGEPFVDVHELFQHYNVLYFRGLLLPRVEVLWSPRLTLCAGICELSKDASTGKFTRIRLKLSTPLLQYRPRDDTINTLLHEAIHAYFFITTSWRHSRGDDGTGHGTGFQLLADAISNHGNYEITIYHTFHDEVDSYRRHVWQCDGPCRQKPPYFGLVKRSMNRPPGKSDEWWARHEAECGGKYTKIQAPELTKKQLEALSKKERAGLQKNKLDTWIRVERKGELDSKGSHEAKEVDSAVSDKASSRRSGAKRTAEAIVDDNANTNNISKRLKPEAKDESGVRDSDGVLEQPLVEHVECPICGVEIAQSDINEHLDQVHFACSYVQLVRMVPRDVMTLDIYAIFYISMYNGDSSSKTLDSPGRPCCCAYYS